MTVNPKKDLGNLLKVLNEESWGCSDFPERIHSSECYSGNSLRKEGKTVRKLSERIAAVT